MVGGKLFWVLDVKQVRERAIIGWVTRWEVLWDVTEWYQSHSAMWFECADEDVGPLRRHETFWELIGFEFHRNFEVKRVRARAILEWVTHWEVLT
ncbi:hypothetical protein DVH24_006645 [Malus domestica]|uniref:Uncharacterized protein n=1 Tax=Malus domestica TaxID=3750 RepID=A0A498KCW8_MALDO|nr:hypothetical protein DVH24_006645 [Malus domestica]